MNEILLNEEKFLYAENDLPLLLHGEDKAGASLYTITIAANLFAHGSKLLFLTGYEMAKQEFKKQTSLLSAEDDRVIFFLKDQAEEFTKCMDTLLDINDRVIIIKNIDLFEERVFDLVSEKQKLIISGDIDTCSFKDKILSKKFKTKIYFSDLKGIELPELQKYQGFLEKDNVSGITTVLIN